MSRKIALPKIDARTASELLKELRARAPHYTREWTAGDDDDAGVGLLKIFSSLAEGVIYRLNRAPERNFLAFLDMLGIRLLPATPARVPVRFLLAAGTPDEVLVPQGTQVAAPPGEGQSEPIPFETLKDMLAIPAKLDTLIAVDPLQDKIYQPPPGFLERETAASVLPQLTTQAFSAAGTKFLQLEPAGQVQPGDFLRIQTSLANTAARADCEPPDATNSSGAASGFEYVVAAAAKGTIITLTEPLRRDYPEQTSVQKLTQFELLAGKDFQAHVLYLGHNKYFEIKSEAQIELTVTLAPGTSANLPARDLAWEFFGIDETQEPKEEKWHTFRVDGDAQSLNQNGQLKLFKPKGEIKETAINGNKSRWIRARLIEALPATPPPSLPKVESITLRVLVKEEDAQGKKEGIPADQAFHNDTPLTVNLSFNPFGIEPRTFDSFYIASAEAFSKLGAEVTLNIDLDFSDLLAAPAAIHRNGKIHVFAQGVAGRLLELQLDPTTQPNVVVPVNHQAPPGTRILSQSIPAVVEDSKKTRIGVLVTGNDGSVYLRVIQSGVVSDWKRLDTQALGNVRFSPAAILNKDKWEIFLVAGGGVYSGTINPESPSEAINWKPLENEFNAYSTPFAISPSNIPSNKNPSGNAWLIITDTKFLDEENPEDGKTHWYDGEKWKVLTPPDATYLAKRKARPFAMIETDPVDNEKKLHVYLRSQADELILIGQVGPKNLLSPSASIKLDSNPYVLNTSDVTRVFVRGTDNQLWERKLDSATTGWRDRAKPLGFDLVGDPFAVAYPHEGKDFVSILSTSNKNSLLEFRFLKDELDTGTLQAGPHNILLLERAFDFSQPDAFFVQITAGPGSGSTADAVRKVNSGLSAEMFAVLEQSLDEITTSESEYRIFKLKEHEPILDVEDDTITLKVATKAEVGNFVFAKDQLREITSLVANKATLKNNWNEKPTGKYDLVRLKSALLEKANNQGVTDDTITLKVNTKAEIGDFVFANGQLRKIKNLAASQATLTEGWDSNPANNSEYHLFGLEIILSEADTIQAPPTSTTVTLKVDTEAKAGDFVFASGQLREIESLTGDNATLIEPWINTPANGVAYKIFRLSGQAQPESNKRAVLGGQASNSPDFYKDKPITFAAAVPQITKIVGYKPTNKDATFDAEFTTAPTSNSSYAIETGDWHPYSLPEQNELRPETSWEYWNGRGWVTLRVADTTSNFLFRGKVTFDLPLDIAKTEVAGQDNYWIRARLIGGDYGSALFTFEEKDNSDKKEFIINKDPIRPPLIEKLTIFYNVKNKQRLQYCLTFNNLTYLDQTAANNTDVKHYPPFVELPVAQPALYFGFDKEFQGGPVRLYCAAKELAVDERNKPKLDWDFTTNNDWQPLPAEDDTDALTKPEFITWTLPGDFQRRQFFGAARYWVRAALAETGEWDESPVLEGVFPNTVAAWQARTVLNEILGSSTATAHQRFRLAQRPVLSGEEVRARETLTQQERDELTAADAKAILDVLDQEGRKLETWVRWREVIEFFNSKPGDRHYRLDRASGEIEFGDNVHGRIPPAGGDNLRVFSYQAGGGTQGNVAAGAINAAVTALAGVEKVSNPAAAGGGSAEATPEEMMEIGPAQISHRDRAVTPDDFERLAQEASREVRKVRCLPNRNQAGRNEVGWVTLQIVPNSKAAQPIPSLELRRSVQRYLAERAEATLVAQEHIFVGAPEYVPVSVRVTLRARSFDVAGRAEARAQERLEQFLHPLTGGPEKEGWDFGRGLAASDLYLLLEDIEEIDHVETLRMFLATGEAEKEVTGELLDINAHALLASGTHKITIKVANGA